MKENSLQIRISDSFDLGTSRCVSRYTRRYPSENKLAIERVEVEEGGQYKQPSIVLSLSTPPKKKRFNPSGVSLYAERVGWLGCWES